MERRARPYRTRHTNMIANSLSASRTLGETAVIHMLKKGRRAAKAGAADEAASEPIQYVRQKLPAAHNLSAP